MDRKTPEVLYHTDPRNEGGKDPFDDLVAGGVSGGAAEPGAEVGKEKVGVVRLEGEAYHTYLGTVLEKYDAIYDALVAKYGDVFPYNEPYDNYKEKIRDKFGPVVEQDVATFMKGWNDLYDLRQSIHLDKAQASIELPGNYQEVMSDQIARATQLLNITPLNTTAGADIDQPKLGDTDAGVGAAALPVAHAVVPEKSMPRVGFLHAMLGRNAGGETIRQAQTRMNSEREFSELISHIPAGYEKTWASIVEAFRNEGVHPATVRNIRDFLMGKVSEVFPGTAQVVSRNNAIQSVLGTDVAHSILASLKATSDITPPDPLPVLSGPEIGVTGENLRSHLVDFLGSERVLDSETSEDPATATIRIRKAYEGASIDAVKVVHSDEGFEVELSGGGSSIGKKAFRSGAAALRFISDELSKDSVDLRAETNFQKLDRQFGESIISLEDYNELKSAKSGFSDEEIDMYLKYIGFDAHEKQRRIDHEKTQPKLFGRKTVFTPRAIPPEWAPVFARVESYLKPMREDRKKNKEGLTNEVLKTQGLKQLGGDADLLLSTRVMLQGELDAFCILRGKLQNKLPLTEDERDQLKIGDNKILQARFVHGKGILAQKYVADLPKGVFESVFSSHHSDPQWVSGVQLIGASNAVQKTRKGILGNKETFITHPDAQYVYDVLNKEVITEKGWGKLLGFAVSKGIAADTAEAARILNSNVSGKPYNPEVLNLACEVFGRNGSTIDKPLITKIKYSRLDRYPDRETQGKNLEETRAVNQVKKELERLIAIKENAEDQAAMVKRGEDIYRTAGELADIQTLRDEGQITLEEYAGAMRWAVRRSSPPAPFDRPAFNAWQRAMKEGIPKAEFDAWRKVEELLPKFVETRRTKEAMTVRLSSKTLVMKQPVVERGGIKLEQETHRIDNLRLVVQVFRNVNTSKQIYIIQPQGSSKFTVREVVEDDAGERHFGTYTEAFNHGLSILRRT